MDDLKRWIPCSERLPEEDGPYLVTLRVTWNMTKYTSLVVTRWIKQEQDWWTSYVEGEEVTAWMPLPDPWKGEEE